ncbi:MAG: hypothetical protein RL477_1555 [Pseudomonadota bacterium]|jgi:predicted O-methyltransferase YrrM
MNFLDRIFVKAWRWRVSAAARLFGGLPGGNSQLSAISSVWDSPFRPDPDLLDLLLRAAAVAKNQDMSLLDSRSGPGERYYLLWPGEHYRLLAALAAVCAARCIVEIGTFTGMGTLALRQGAAPGVEVHTFDVVPWDSFDGSWLQADDFSDGIVQHVDDLSAPEAFARHRDLLSRADLIFFDGPKDRVTEQRMIDNFGAVPYTKPPVVVFDDILAGGMIHTWARLAWPKLDATALGHWTGTGPATIPSLVTGSNQPSKK